MYYGRGGKFTSKPRVVVLGSGWGAMSFIKSLGSGGPLSFLGNNRSVPEPAPEAIHVFITLYVPEPCAVMHAARPSM